MNTEAAMLAAPGKTTTRSGYAWFVLLVLVAVYGANFADRYIFIIMMEPIKRDLHLSDTQLGLISGLAFSAIYSVAGLAVARWADIGNRRSIIAAALAAWSALTALCGLTSSFFQLLIARMGVGVAESACSPPAYSLISDYFPQRMRALAFSIYSVGLSVGLALGFIVGGWIGEHYGWRAAFIAVGVPGILLAAVTRLSVREPQRGASDMGIVDATRYSAREAVAYMLRRPSFMAYMLGSALFVFAGTAIDSWAPLFLMRVHGLPEGEVGLWTGVLGASAGLTGAVTAGWLADRLSIRDLRWHLWVALGGVALEVPATLFFLFSKTHMVPPFYFASVFLDAVYMPPTIAITHAIMPVRMRALASAVLLLGYNLIGTAGCNFVIGYFSDRWAASLNVNSVRYAMAITQFAALAGAIFTIYAIVRLPRDFRDKFGS
ncbi:MAG TPA: MFS transporter [Steroidobacteraceae bacterium]|nr:MFS transporter [Steroidobacteraceae bacterium]